jgi:hypothetical protein
MDLIHKLSGEGFESLSEQEIKSLLRDLLFQPSYLGHLAPLLKAELDARHATKLNRRTLYISILALVVSLASLINSWLS